MNAQNTSYGSNHGSGHLASEETDQQKPSGDRDAQQTNRQTNNGPRRQPVCRSGFLSQSCPACMGEECDGYEATCDSSHRRKQTELAFTSPMLSRSVKDTLLACHDRGPIDGQKKLAGLHSHPNDPSYHGRTAFQIIVAKGDETDVDTGLDAGGDVDIPAADGTTALMIAVTTQDAETVKTLCRQSADLDRGDARGWTALMRAAAIGSVSNLCALLDESCEVNHRDQKSRTALWYSVANAHPQGPHHDHLAVVRALLNAGADVNHADAAGWTALMVAAVKGDVEMARTLLNSGAKPGLCLNADGRTTALCLAIKEGQVEIVRLLVRQHGAFAMAPGASPADAFDLALRGGNLDTVKVLLQLGLRFGQCSPEKLMQRYPELRKVLASRNVDLESTAIIDCLLHGAWDAVHALGLKRNELLRFDGAKWTLDSDSWQRLCRAHGEISEEKVADALRAHGFDERLIAQLLKAVCKVEPALKHLFALMESGKLRIDGPDGGRAKLSAARIRQELFDFAVTSCEPVIQLAYPPAARNVADTRAMRQAKALYDALEAHYGMPAALRYRAQGLNANDAIRVLEFEMPELLRHWLSERCYWVKETSCAKESCLHAMDE